MKILVCYDVATDDTGGRRRLRKIAEMCKDHGVRVQYSVFECDVSDHLWVRLRHDLLRLMNSDRDSLRFYYIDEAALRRTEHHGVRLPLDLSGPLIL